MRVGVWEDMAVSIHPITAALSTHSFIASLYVTGCVARLAEGVGCEDGQNRCAEPQQHARPCEAYCVIHLPH